MLADLQEKYQATVGALNEGLDHDPEKLRSGGLGLLAGDIGAALDLGFTRKRIWTALNAAGYPGSYGYFTVKMNRVFGKGKQAEAVSSGIGREPLPPGPTLRSEGVEQIASESRSPEGREKEDWEIRREEAALSIERDREKSQSLDELAKKKKFIPKTFNVGG